MPPPQSFLPPPPLFLSHRPEGGGGKPTDPRPCQEGEEKLRGGAGFGAGRMEMGTCVSRCLLWPGSQPPPTRFNPRQPGRSHRRQRRGPGGAQFGEKSCFFCVQRFTQRSVIYPSPFWLGRGLGGVGRSSTQAGSRPSLLAGQRRSDLVLQLIPPWPVPELQLRSGFYAAHNSF